MDDPGGALLAAASPAEPPSPGTSTLLPADDRSPGAARRILSLALQEAGLDALLDDALLLVTELVTNAIVHVGTEVELRIDVGVGQARVEVVDRGVGALPVLREGDPLSEGGRGILLLGALAHEWGTRTSASGTAVWFSLGVADRAVLRPLPLPRGPADELEPSPPVMSWLLGLPADLEERLTPAQLLTELLHRLCGATGLSNGWLYAEGTARQSSWTVVAAHDPSARLPDLARLQTLALERSDRMLPGPEGLLVLPMRRRSGVFGALVIGPVDELDDAGRSLARLVADRMAVVLRDDRAHARQQRDRDSLLLLSRASEMFAATLDVTLAVTLTAQLIVPRFATWSGVYTVEEQGVRLAAVAHTDEAQVDDLRAGLAGEPALELVGGLLGRLGEQPALVPVEELPTELAELAAQHAGGVLAVPLVARRRMLGVLLAGQSGGVGAGTRITPGSGRASDDAGLLLDLARRAALTVDNARMYSERHAIAKTLQSFLLPPDLPTVPHVEFGARYAAAGEGNDVGGDFYDVFELPGGRWTVAIGDVCGKGAEAAVITGLARNVLRLLGQGGSAVPETLRRLNAAILDLGERGRFCTTAMATLRPSPAGLSVRLSAAGHPPPVLVTAAGEARYVGRNGSLLGVFEDIEVVEDDLLMAPGDALVFYTDGVTERRDGPRMFGDDSLLPACAAAVGHSADAMAGRLEQAVKSFSEQPSRDDLAVLVVRAVP